MTAQSASATSSPSAPPTALPGADLLAQVADALAWPLLLLQRDATLLHANRAAHRLLDAGQPLRLGPRRRLQPATAARQAAFDSALHDCAPQQPRLLHWPARSGSFTATLTTLPLVRDDGGVALQADDPLLLALTLPGGHSANVAGFARLHALSEAESRVLQHLADGDNSRRTASALGVSASTVRSQAASLRRKTGHASVPDLLCALAALPPLASPGAHDGE